MSRARPAVLAQVEQRLAGAVAGQLGLGAVGVVDPQARDVAGLVGGREREHAVGADAEVAVAQRAHAVGADPGRLDDQVVVAERLPLLELHGCDHAVQLGGDVRRVAAGDVERADVGELAHPRELALGVAAGAGLHRLDVAREQLLEAERLARGGARRLRGGPLGPPRRAPAATIASTRAPIRSASASRSITRPASSVGWRVSVVHSWLAAAGGGYAGVEQLERADEPLAVGGRDAGGDVGRAPGQLGVQRLRPDRLQRRLPAAPGPPAPAGAGRARPARRAGRGRCRPRRSAAARRRAPRRSPRARAARTRRR